MKKVVLGLMLAVLLLLPNVSILGEESLDDISEMPVERKTADSEKSGDDITWLFEEGELTISGTGEMYDYYQNADAPLFDWSTVTALIISKDVTEIPSDVFPYLKRVIFEEGTTKIADNILDGWKNVTEIVIPEGVREIGKDAFSGCSGLKVIDLPKSVREIGKGAFSGCSGLTEIAISENIISLDIFSDCSNIRKVTFKEGTTIIADNLLNDWITVTEVVISEDVKTIGENAFSGCSGLTQMILPYKIESIGQGAFENCDKLQNINLPISVRTIGDRAFSRCESLIEVSLPNGITELGSGVFANCTKLSKVKVPSGLKTIGSNAFENCDALKEIALPESLSEIGDNVFYDCDALEKIHIPDAVTKMGTYAFYHCDALKDVGIGTGMASIPQYTFACCNGLEEIIIPYPVEMIETGAFWGCDSLASITLPRELSLIEDEVFSDTYLLTIYGIEGTYAETYAKQNDIKFVNQEKKAEEVVLHEVEMVLGVGQEKVLGVTIVPEDFVGEIVWTSENPAVAEVDGNGKISGKAAGTTGISVTVGNITEICRVTVMKFVTDISLSCDDTVIEIGETAQIASQVYPLDATNQTLVWESSDATIAEVSQDGIVTALKKGTVEIRAAAADGSNVSKTIIITVRKEHSEEISKDELGDVLEEDIPEGGMEAIPKGFWIAGIDENGYAYTGKAIKPTVRVYDYKTLLVEKTDYTISYKNNTAANDASVEKTAPTIMITGKGNYSGKETVKFKILPVSIEDEAFVLNDLVAAYNGKVQKPVPVLSWNGKNLKNKTDFKVSYISADDNAYKDAGVYILRVQGVKNFTGTRDIKLEITQRTLMSKVTVKGIKNLIYTGNALTQDITVKHGKTVLTEGVHYTISYQNNVEIGTASVVLTGINEYHGQKKLSFKITGTNIKNAKVADLPKSVVYHGESIRPVCSLQVKEGKDYITLRNGTDYTVEYINNIKAGTATVVFTGKNGYTGTLKKTFKISKYNIKTDADNLFTIEEGIVTPTVKGGNKPKPQVMFDGMILKEGVDYTLSYKNNKGVNDGSNPKKIPTITITGKGNFTGTGSVSFEIIQQDIGNLTISVSDKIYSNKKNGYKVNPVIKDTDGKILTLKTDYLKDFKYTYKNDTILENGTIRRAGDVVGTGDIVPEGTVIQVTVYGTKNYSGQLTGEYRILAKGKDIKNAKVEVIPELYYTGSAIVLDESDLKVKIGKYYLDTTEFEIVEGSYKNNVKKGKASVTIRGLGEYGGTKTITFTIKAEKFTWWK